MNYRIINKYILPVTISAIFIFLLFKKIDIHNFLIVKDKICIYPMLIGFIILFSANLIRARRFQIVDSTQLRFSQWWVIGQVYNMLTAVLPGGGGEAATAYALKRLTLHKFVGSLRIFILTRLMDVLCIAGVLISIMAVIGDIFEYNKYVTFVSIALFFVSLLLIIPSTERVFINVLEKLIFGSGTNSKYLLKKINHLKEAALLSSKQRAYIHALALSIMIFLGAAFSVHYVLFSYGVNFSVAQSFYCFGIFALFQMVPIQGIAGIGTQAAWWSIALHAAGYNGNDKIAIGFALHATFYIFIFLIGITAIIFHMLKRKS